jgi:hypothetical protein
VKLPPAESDAMRRPGREQIAAMAQPSGFKQPS